VSPELHRRRDQAEASKDEDNEDRSTKGRPLEFDVKPRGLANHVSARRDEGAVDEALTIAPREREHETHDVVDDPREGVRQKGLVHERRPSAIDRASAYLASMPPAIQGSRGGTATYKAALVRGFALDEGTAFALLAREYNPRCKPPWPAKGLARKVNEAAKATRVGLGYLLPERTR
jgi:hypothetical protein